MEAVSLWAASFEALRAIPVVDFTFSYLLISVELRPLHPPALLSTL